jgi:hypothetical protein
MSMAAGYEDDLTFGTVERRWFAERGAEMVRVDARRVHAIILLQDTSCPGLAEARALYAAEVRAIQDRRQMFRKAAITPGGGR